MPRPCLTSSALPGWQAPRTVEAYFATAPGGGEVQEVVLYTLSLGTLAQPIARLELLVEPFKNSRAKVRLSRSIGRAVRVVDRSHASVVHGMRGSVWQLRPRCVACRTGNCNEDVLSPLSSACNRHADLKQRAQAARLGPCDRL